MAVCRPTATHRDRSGWDEFRVPVLCAACVLVLSLGLFSVADAGRQGMPAVLVFPPNWSPDSVVAATYNSGFSFIEMGPLPFTSIAVALEDDAIERARHAGMLIAFGGAIGVLCGTGRAGPDQI